MRRRWIGGLVAVLSLAALTSRATAPVAVLILDGESGGAYHD